MPIFNVTVEIKADSQKDAFIFLNDANNGLHAVYRDNPKVERATVKKSTLRPAPQPVHLLRRISTLPDGDSTPKSDSNP